MKITREWLEEKGDCALAKEVLSAPLFAEFSRQRDLLWEEFERQCEREAYERRNSPFLEEYKRQCHKMFAEYERQCGNLLLSVFGNFDEAGE